MNLSSLSFDNIFELLERYFHCSPSDIALSTDKNGFYRMVIKPTYPVDFIIELYRKAQENTLTPKDSEAGAFLGDIPLFVDNRNKASVTEKGKCQIIGVSAEELFLRFSSLHFSLTVDALARSVKDHRFRTAEWHSFLSPIHDSIQSNISIPAVGKTMISSGLVDSVFGNISKTTKTKTMIISASGSMLDTLENELVVCQPDGQCNGTPSSEYKAHRLIAEHLPFILHGHPRATVALSIAQPEHFTRIPLVEGESGPGINGLWKTVPAAVYREHVATVKGHGVFCASNTGFDETFSLMTVCENDARYFFLQLM